MANGKVKVTLVKSPIGTKRAHRACVKGLGLKRLHESVELTDTPEVRGMIQRIRYLLRLDPV